MPPSIGVTRYTIGILALLSVVCIWVSSSFLMNVRPLSFLRNGRFSHALFCLLWMREPRQQQLICSLYFPLFCLPLPLLSCLCLSRHRMRELLPFLCDHDPPFASLCACACLACYLCPPLYPFHSGHPQNIFAGQNYNKPFFVTYVNTASFSFYLLGPLFRHWRESCAGRGYFWARFLTRSEKQMSTVIEETSKQALPNIRYEPTKEEKNTCYMQIDIANACKPKRRLY